jgi:hypothetical protein
MKRGRDRLYRKGSKGLRAFPSIGGVAAAPARVLTEIGGAGSIPRGRSGVGRNGEIAVTWFLFGPVVILMAFEALGGG